MISCTTPHRPVLLLFVNLLLHRHFDIYLQQYCHFLLLREAILIFKFYLSFIHWIYTFIKKRTSWLTLLLRIREVHGLILYPVTR
jgi:hypothetical protein